MGLFDTFKEKANALAADAERAGKVTAAQARTIALQNDIRKAERELGHAAFSLLEEGKLAHPDLEPAVGRLRDAHLALQEKEAEIAALRSGPTAAEPPSDATAGTAETPAGGNGNSAVAKPAQPAEPATGSADTALATDAPTADAGSAKKAPSKRRAAAAKKPPAKKATSKKPPARRPPAKDK
jgi:hypothetical protein